MSTLSTLCWSAMQEGIPHNHAVLLPYLAVTDLVLRPITSTDRHIFIYFRWGSGGSLRQTKVISNRSEMYSYNSWFQLAAPACAGLETPCPQHLQQQ